MKELVIIKLSNKKEIKHKKCRQRPKLEIKDENNESKIITIKKRRE